MHTSERDEAITLRAVITAVSSTLELDEVLAGVVDIATEATDCHACLIYLVEGDRLVLRAVSPVHAALVGRIAMDVGEGVTGWVARRNRPAFIREGALGDPRMRYFPELQEERFQSMAAVPVRARAGEVIGVIVLHTAAPREFHPEVVALLENTASLVGGAIENAQLYEQARRRVGALTQLAAVSQRLAAATSHGELHAAATSGARALLGADSCSLFRGGGDELRLVAADPPGADRRAAPATLTAPLVASDAHLGLLVVAGPRFAPGDEELLAALADQTAMGIERADLIARLRDRDRMKELFDALAGDAPDGVVRRAAPPGCDVDRPHRIVCGTGDADWAAVAARLPGAFADVSAAGLRAVVPARTACGEAGAPLGVSAVATSPVEAREALKEAERAAAVASLLGTVVRYEDLGALAHVELGAAGRDRHRAAALALRDHDRERSTALLPTLEAFLARRSVTATARALFIHPNTLRQRLARIEAVAGVDLAEEDMLALELAVKLVRLA